MKLFVRARYVTDNSNGCERHDGFLVRNLLIPDWLLIPSFSSLTFRAEISRSDVRDIQYTFTARPMRADRFSISVTTTRCHLSSEPPACAATSHHAVNHRNSAEPPSVIAGSVCSVIDLLFGRFLGTTIVYIPLETMFYRHHNRT